MSLLEPLLCCKKPATLHVGRDSQGPLLLIALFALVQVWYSAGWTASALHDFNEVVTAVLKH